MQLGGGLHIGAEGGEAAARHGTFPPEEAVEAETWMGLFLAERTSCAQKQRDVGVVISY